MAVDVTFSIIVVLMQVFFGILLSILSVYLSLRFFDKMTEDIDEIAELKKGNVAVAIVLLALVASIGTIVKQGVQQFDEILLRGVSLPFFMIAFVMAIVQLVFVVLIAVLTMYVAIVLLDSMTVGINELKELKRGNIAVALLIAGVLYTVAFIVSGTLSNLSTLSIFKPEMLAGLLGIQ
ncbi:Uncharacterised protein [uncultured archaeon]|nr:Uncharacterised protein [uncultured archaeon]